MKCLHEARYQSSSQALHARCSKWRTGSSIAGWPAQHIGSNLRDNAMDVPWPKSGPWLISTGASATCTGYTKTRHHHSMPEAPVVQ